ncbi:hypothetical protein AMAG_18796 [Allomyces macrogynus ATCC 38327]|uniref:Uncharacterized protein n=1 Tax=Allomyces macrogynus (strain ATCC 38327) TaxID=578462 RepID=A0A0L0SHU2_ALLM3|nr:hypothetical protein AMAG_18796 [Allomyces macrogynus ATCC 38327]|eukprot:KNE62012.1 hypothetical protein AMAG_18796 [Allomyces macrogynus ATCC 38327]
MLGIIPPNTLGGRTRSTSRLYTANEFAQIVARAARLQKGALLDRMLGTEPPPELTRNQAFDIMKCFRFVYEVRHGVWDDGTAVTGSLPLVGHPPIASVLHGPVHPPPVPRETSTSVTGPRAAGSPLPATPAATPKPTLADLLLTNDSATTGTRNGSHQGPITTTTTAPSTPLRALLPRPSTTLPAAQPSPPIPTALRPRKPSTSLASSMLPSVATYAVRRRYVSAIGLLVKALEVPLDENGDTLARLDVAHTDVHADLMTDGELALLDLLDAPAAARERLHAAMARAGSAAAAAALPAAPVEQGGAQR